MKQIKGIFFFLILFSQVKGQLLFYQDTYKGGITSDGVSYYGTEYGQADTINFQLHIPVSSTIHKAILISRGGFDINQQDYPLQLNYNSNAITLDSTDIITLEYGCNFSSNTSYNWMVAKDVTGSTLYSGNKLLVPCQTCVNRTIYYIGFSLVVFYENPTMPTVNAALFIQNQTENSVMTESLTGLNKIDTSKDVGLSIWTDDVHSFPGNYTLTYSLASSLGNFPIGTLDQHYIGGYKKTLPGSFYYENNTLFGLVDDTPDAFIDSTDALVNIKNYINNNAISFTLTSTGGSSPGCINTRNTYVLAYSTPCPARSNKDTTYSYNICVGNSQALAISGLNSGNIYTWYASDGSLTTVTTPTVTVTPTVSTNYIAYVDSAGCKHTEHFKVLVNPIPKTDSVQITNAICGQSLGTAIILPPKSGGNTIMYNIGSGYQSSDTLHNLSAGVYSYTVTNSAGCVYVKSNSFTVTEINPAIATFSFTPNPVCVNEPVNFINTSNTNLQWWHFTGNDTSNFQNPVYTFSDTGYYTVTLIGWRNIRYCSDTIIHSIYVQECPPDSLVVITPNIFTPNGDEINDTWLPVIYNLGFTVNDFSVVIFDRWGLKIFESANINNGWDGHTTSGIECSSGTYYFVVNYKVQNSKAEPKKQTLKGFLQLIR